MYILGVTGLVEGAEEYALLFGLWTAFVEVVPYIGPWLSAVPPLIFALSRTAWGVLWVGILFLFIYQVEGHIVVPNVMANALRLHPLLVIFGLLAGGELYGIAGVLVALPTMAGVRAIWEFFRERVELRAGTRAARRCRWRSSSNLRKRRAGRGSVSPRVGDDHGGSVGGEPALGRGGHARRRAGACSPCSRRSALPGRRSGSRRSTRDTSCTTAGPGSSRQPDRDGALLLGDYLYAHGLVRVAQTGDVAAVSDLAELISLCAQARADGRDGDGPAWAATAAVLGRGGLELPRNALREQGDPSLLDATARLAAGDDAVDRALGTHARLVG